MECFGEVVVGCLLVVVVGDVGIGFVLGVVIWCIWIGVVGDDFVIVDFDDVLCVLGYVYVVGDDDDGVVFGM